MNKLIRLSKTGIEYGDYAWNFASGCGNNTEGKCNSGGFNCWAYPITQRFADRYPNGFKPTIYPEALLSPLYLKKPSRILCAFMGDLFWDCPEFDPNKMINVSMVPGLSQAEPLKERIFRTIRACPQHTFLFLTKQPKNLIKFSPFPDNCWVGVSATDYTMNIQALLRLSQIEANVKYLSYEPLLGQMLVLPEDFKRAGIKGVIIGAQTKPYKPPKIEWVKEIVEACDKAGVKVFLKDNLKLALPFKKAEWAWARNKQLTRQSTNVVYAGGLRQELPDA